MKLCKNFDTQMKKLLSVAALAGAVLLCSCGGNKTLKMGSLSKFDSLSYALGANIGYGMQYEMSDIPFNFEEVNKGIKEARSTSRSRSTRMPSTSCAITS